MRALAFAHFDAAPVVTDLPVPEATPGAAWRLSACLATSRPGAADRSRHG